MIVRTRRFALVTLAVVSAAAAAPANAQQTSPTPDAALRAARSHPAPAGPTLDRAAVGVRPLSQNPATLDDAESAMQSRLGLGRARALMIVGFGAVVVGLLIGDDVGTLIAVAGAAVGLYGLYHYLK